MRIAILALAVVTLSRVASADELQEAFLAAQSGAPEEWVVISNHFRHSENCTSDGCIVMGPMSDREACEDWSASYNRIDPFDHTRCVAARSYAISNY